jgi:gamma-D-glutamyl-L-lysine dipeptidyl-peptidase
MKFGICLLSAVPVRTEPSDKAEMCTQMLFGELVNISDQQNNWLKVRILNDNYEGWVDYKQIQLIGGAEFLRMTKEQVHYTKELVGVLQDNTGGLIPILFGSTFRNAENNSFVCCGKTFTFNGDLTLPGKKPVASTLIEDALLYINSPYQWGGKSPFGIDCSGFTQVIYKVNGVDLLRDAAQQATQGETISLIEEAEPGDLLFFDNEEGKIVHVGILISNHEIIHASGKVKKDKIDHLGIYNQDLMKYTHNLRIIKRLI